MLTAATLSSGRLGGIFPPRRRVILTPVRTEKKQAGGTSWSPVTRVSAAVAPSSAPFGSEVFWELNQVRSLKPLSAEQ